jgi:hypothetical protein
MYRLEGHFSYTPDPAELIGQFGVHQDLTQQSLGRFATLHSQADFTGSEEQARRIVNILRAAGGNPEMEEITSAEQAVRYNHPVGRRVKAETHRQPDIMDVVTSKVPEGGELKTAQARLWKEYRFPTSWIYCGALGKLLKDVTYTVDNGWQDRFDVLKETRVKLGLMTSLGGFWLAATTGNNLKYTDVDKWYDALGITPPAR